MKLEPREANAVSAFQQAPYNKDFVAMLTRMRDEYLRDLKSQRGVELIFNSQGRVNAMDELIAKVSTR